MLIMSRKKSQEKEREGLAFHDMDGRQVEKEGWESEEVEMVGVSRRLHMWKSYRLERRKARAQANGSATPLT